MKLTSRIEKIVNTYLSQQEDTATKIKALKVQLSDTRKRANSSLDLVECSNLSWEVEEIKTEIKVQEKKRQILIQARVDIDSILNHI